MSKGQDKGQMRSVASEPFGVPLSKVPPNVMGMESLHNDIGEKSGFQTSGYIDKKGTPFGEAAKFNFMPPGMDITHQENAEFNNMPMKKLTAESYPGDGWTPAPRDIPE